VGDVEKSYETHTEFQESNEGWMKDEWMKDGEPSKEIGLEWHL
jgi:hypothetical protein